MTTIDEKEIEERLRGVVQGPQPEAPVSLHRFLHDLPETEAAHHHGPIGHLRGYFDRLPVLVAPHPNLRRAQLGFGVAMAVVIGVAGAGLFINLRNAPATPAASGSPGQTGPWQTPRRSIGTHQPPVQASLNVEGLLCWGVPHVENESMALPIAAIVTNSGKYLGVTGGAFGMTGMVHSDDGIFWNWSPPTEVGSHASIVTAIASDENSTIVVTGGVQGIDGTTDGRIWTSTDDGATWHESKDEATFKGITVQAITYSPGRWLALGWNGNTAPDALRQVAAWRSEDDGQTWTHVSTPIKGTSALLTSTAAGFILSGAPLAATGAIDEPPIWYSPDGTNWNRSKTIDNTAQLMGPLTSATVTGVSHIYAVSASPDGTSKHLVASWDGGLNWESVKPDDSLPYADSISHVASLSNNSSSARSYEVLFATIGTGNDSYAHIMISKDGGTTWTRLIDNATGGPAGNVVVDLGHGWQAGGNVVLSYGDPGSGIGVWITELQ
jgi:hypothetical protein